MEEMEAAINASTSPEVKIWMNWMMIIFLSSLVFVYQHKSARFIIAALVVSLPIAILIFNITKSPPLIGIAHIIVWIPLAYYLIKTEFIGKSERIKSIYGIYLVLLLTTIFISLYFDLRDAILILSGIK